MATTTNYSWTTPDDTDLVKDGAAAIRTLGSSADTTVKDLNPGTTAGDIDYYTSSTAKARIAIGTANQVLQVNSGATAPEWGVDPVADVITTAGDLLYGTAADTVARLGIGTAGQVLQVNSGATAPEWAAAGTGGLTLISTSIPSSATAVDFTSISSEYKMLIVTWAGLYASSNNTNFLLRLNNNSANAYNYREIGFDNNTPTNTFVADDKLPVFVRTTSTAEVDTGSGYLMIFNANSTTLDKYCEGVTSYKRADTSALTIRRHSCHYNDTTAISQINFFRAETAGTINVTSGGFIQLWGVK